MIRDNFLNITSAFAKIALQAKYGNRRAKREKVLPVVSCL